MVSYTQYLNAYLNAKYVYAFVIYLFRESQLLFTAYSKDISQLFLNVDSSNIVDESNKAAQTLQMKTNLSNPDTKACSKMKTGLLPQLQCIYTSESTDHLRF